MKHADEYACFMPVGEIFSLTSNGVKTNRDDVVYDFQRDTLVERVKRFIEDFNAEVDRYRRAGRPEDVDNFVRYENVKWSGTLKTHLERGSYLCFEAPCLRGSLYRPFVKRQLYFDRGLVERVYQLPRIFPAYASANLLLVLSAIGYRASTFSAIACDCIPEQHLCAASDGHQCFPFYTYAPDGTNRKENITDEALKRFREEYSDSRITKWDIFHYIYAVLHHPGYREKFAENLKRELPRIPFASDFHAFAQAGKDLARLHVEYESLEPWPLEFICAPDQPLSYEVRDKMRLSKDKTSLQVNSSLTLAGIPPEVYEYRLGNRSALEWVVDQYQVSEDARSGIRSDPNRKDDPEYIVRLAGQVVRVSLETVRLVRSLPNQYSR
jgi:predicted helicase